MDHQQTNQGRSSATYVLFHHSILPKIILFAISVIDVSFFTSFTNVILGLSLSFHRLEPTHSSSLMH